MEVVKEEMNEDEDTERPRKRAANIQQLSKLSCPVEEMEPGGDLPASHVPETAQYEGYSSAPMWRPVDYEHSSHSHAAGSTEYASILSPLGSLEEREHRRASMSNPTGYEGYTQFPPLPPAKPDGDDSL